MSTPDPTLSVSAGCKASCQANDGGLEEQRPLSVLSDWDALARDLFEASSGGVARPPEEIIAQLVPHVRQRIVRHCRRLGASCDHVEDVLQDVLLRIWSKPPSRWRDEQDPKATLLAWIGTVTTRCLIDRFRRSCVPLDSELDALADLSDGTRNVLRFELASQLKAARGILEKHYSVALPVFELLLEDPELSSKELAVQLNRSPGNVDQIRFRMRLVLAEYGAVDGAKRHDPALVEESNP